MSILVGPGLLQKRFDELTQQLTAVENTLHYEGHDLGGGHYVDAVMLLEWSVKARNLLARSCQKDSEHYKTFVEKEAGAGHWSNHGILKDLKAVFKAAKEDFEGGYITSIRSLVQAEVFDSELDQARELLRGGYVTAAAVVAGVALETALRTLCQNHGLGLGSLNKMNAELHKAGVYNLLVQKRVTALADIRNNAAHGHPSQFTETDVADMIRQVESFLADHL